MATEQVKVPDIGGSEGAEVIELLVAVGDEVEVDQGLIVLESDKASMEIPSTVAGKVVELHASEGDELVEGSPVATIEVAGQAAAGEGEDTAEAGSDDGDGEARAGGEGGEKPAEPRADEGEDETEDKDKDKDGETPGGEGTRRDESGADTTAGRGRDADRAVPSAAGGDKRSEPAGEDGDGAAGGTAASRGVYAGPAVRKLAREFGVPLDDVDGSGPGGRVLKEDLQQYVRRSFDAPAAGGAALPAVPDVDFAEFGEVEVSQRSKLDRLTAENMHRSWLNVPHVTQFDEADITGLESFRAGLKAEAEERGTKITPLPFILKACALALHDNPRLNSSVTADGRQLVTRQYCHIGMAVDTPAGLLVPVIRDVDRKGIWELAEEILDLAGKARERKLTPAQMQGGSFTVSSLGSIGGRGFTPIINTPEVGILGVSRAAVRPVWDGDAFQPRTLLPLALSYDHRVVNGGDGGRFLTRVVELLSDIRRLML